MVNRRREKTLYYLNFKNTHQVFQEHEAYAGKLPKSKDAHISEVGEEQQQSGDSLDHPKFC